MLLKEKLKQINFSPSESEVIRFLQANETTLADRTIQQIAETCYVHPSTLIRIAKKMGFHGWVDFRDAFIAETEYLQGNFQEVDANLPFSENEGIMTIANRIAALERMTIQDTLSLLMHDDLQQAKQLLLRSNKIVLFSSDTNTLIAQSFKLKMNRIKQEVTILPTSGESYYDAYNCQPENCAILISYTGENQMMLRTAEILKEKNVPILSLTSIGESSLSTASDVVLRLTTRERLYSKISSFTINTSISYLLDVLYSCVFAEHYRENLDYLIEVGQKVDTRQISSSIMKEELFTDSIEDGD